MEDGHHTPVGTDRKAIRVLSQAEVNLLNDFAAGGVYRVQNALVRQVREHRVVFQEAEEGVKPHIGDIFARHLVAKLVEYWLVGFQVDEEHAPAIDDGERQELAITTDKR